MEKRRYFCQPAQSIQKSNPSEVNTFLNFINWGDNSHFHLSYYRGQLHMSGWKDKISLTRLPVCLFGSPLSRPHPHWTCPGPWVPLGSAFPPGGGGWRHVAGRCPGPRPGWGRLGLRGSPGQWQSPGGCGARASSAVCVARAWCSGSTSDCPDVSWLWGKERGGWR